jgi:hypothetical protein
MTVYLYCRKCLRAFAAHVWDEKGTPRDHGKELLDSDLKRVEYEREFVGCAFDDCKGSLPDFAWWKDVRMQAKTEGLEWPEQAEYGVKYELPTAVQQSDRTMARSKKEKPSAQCPRCGKVAHDIRYVNERCNAQINGKRCDGFFRSMLHPGDWKECPGCNATGRTDESRCIKCSGEGWINVRDKQRASP